MVLSAQAIQKAVTNKHIGIEPFDEHNVKLASYTFTLDDRIRLLETNQVIIIGEHVHYQEYTIPSDGFVLEPGQFALGVTREKVTLNNAYACTLSARGSCAQVGLSVLLSSTFAEPDTDNYLALEIANVSGVPIRLMPGMKIVKGVFSKITEQV